MDDNNVTERIDIEQNQQIVINPDNNDPRDIYLESSNKDNNQIQNNTNNDNINEKYDTLDESIQDTLKRDLTRIGHKLLHVVNPIYNSNDKNELKDWDLWGPLLFGILLCAVISFRDSIRNNNAEQTISSTFSILFCFMFFGSVILSLNSIFLDVSIKIIQFACLLGYCLFPFLVGSFINLIFIKAKLIVLDIIVVFLAIVWASWSGIRFIIGITPTDKKVVVIFPIILYFISLGLLILL